MTKEERDDFHEHLKLRVPAVQEAIKRTRFAFFLCTLASFASMICLWNTYLSTYRFLAEKPLPVASRDSCCVFSDTDRERELLIDAFRAWVDSTSISINLLGIRIGVSDFSLLDSIAMYIFLYYSLLTTRRENREVGQLLQDINHELDIVGYAAYSAINSYMVFNLNRTDDSPICRLKAPTTKGKKIAVIRGVYDILAWAPAVVIILIVASDLLSLISKSPYPFSSPFRFGTIGGDSRAFPVEMIEYVAMDVFAVVIASLSVLAIRQIRMYGSATRDVLDEFSIVLREHKLLAKNVSET